MEGLILTCRQLADGLILAGGLLLLAEFQLAGNLLKWRVLAYGLLPLLADGPPHGDEGCSVRLSVLLNARVGRAGTTPGPAYSFFLPAEAAIVRCANHNVPRCEPSISVVLTLAFTNQERDTAQSHYAGNAGDSVEGNTCIGSGGAFHLGGLCRLGVMAARCNGGAAYNAKCRLQQRPYRQ